MGNFQSNYVKICVQLLNEVTTNIVNKQTTNDTATAIAGQTMRVKFTGGNIKNCKIDISQRAIVKQNVKLMATFSDTSELVSALTSAANDRIDQASKSELAALALSLNCQNNTTDIKDKVSNIITTNITNIQTTELNTFIQSIQNLDVEFVNETIDCGGSELTISQENIVHQISRLITNMVIKDKVTGTSDASTDAGVGQHNDDKQKGIGGALLIIVLIIGAIIFFPAISPLLMKAAGDNKALKIAFIVIIVTIIALICYYAYKKISGLLNLF